MLLNAVEKALMNNPARAALQRHLEAKWLLELGGRMDGGIALEVGCGRGVGIDLILRDFGARRVDAFDLDPRMTDLAAARFRGRDEVRIWTGDVSRIEASDGMYDAVFDFGIIHHVPDWRDALKEVRRVLKPGGRFYSEEVLRRFIVNPVVRRLLEHPLQNRFDHATFIDALAQTGLRVVSERQLAGLFGWYVADRPAS